MKYLLIALLIFSGSINAAPKKADAEKWYKDFRAAKDKVFDGLFITKTKEHMQFNGTVVQLVSRAEKLFGEPLTSELANCTIVAISLQSAWGEMEQITRTQTLKNNTLPLIASMAWGGGEKYESCLDQIDKLK